MKEEKSQDIKTEKYILHLLSRNVRLRRIELGLSQEQLAERANFHPTYISRIECGLRNISLVNLYRLAVALDLSVFELLAEK